MALKDKDIRRQGSDREVVLPHESQSFHLFRIEGAHDNQGGCARHIASHIDLEWIIVRRP